MKYIKSYILFILMVFALSGCNKYDDLKDDVNDLKDRVTLIEQQVKLLNDNLAVIGYILDTQNKTVSGVEKSADGTQHVITLSDGKKLYLTIGKPGTIEEPVITVGDDKMWYINGVSTGIVAVGEDGKNGDGFPEFQVKDGKWQVRFGGGAWTDVKGGTVTDGGSLGDQVFESAAVSEDGKNFIVTLKNGTVCTLPIVEELSCHIAINPSKLVDGFLVIEKGNREIIPVKIVGENPQVTYPQGWRATIQKLAEVDGNGNNYQLLIFAPAGEMVQSRAVADNTADVTVQVQKGSFWAVDKIKVKTPLELSSNMESYKAGQTLKVGELEITQSIYGDPEALITADATISKGGVYFVSTNNVTLTYALTDAVENLIIIPNTEDVTTINLKLTKQPLLNNTFACQNVIVDNAAKDYLLKVNSTDVSVSLDNCKMTLLKGKGVAIPSGTTNSLKHFEINSSDIKIDEIGANFYAIKDGMDCGTLNFKNNIVYYSQDYVSGGLLPSSFKVFAGNKNNITTLNLSGNTFIDIDSSTATSVTGLIYANSVTNITVDKNIYWLATSAKVTTCFLRFTVTGLTGSGSDNYGYVYSPAASNEVIKMNFSASTAVSGISEVQKQSDIFDVSNSLKYNKLTGVFIPNDAYKAFGAQR